MRPGWAYLFCYLFKKKAQVKGAKKHSYRPHTLHEILDQTNATRSGQRGGSTGLQPGVQPALRIHTLRHVPFASSREPADRPRGGGGEALRRPLRAMALPPPDLPQCPAVPESLRLRVPPPVMGNRFVGLGVLSCLVLLALESAQRRICVCSQVQAFRQVRLALSRLRLFGVKQKPERVELLFTSFLFSTWAGYFPFPTLSLLGRGKPAFCERLLLSPVDRFIEITKCEEAFLWNE